MGSLRLICMIASVITDPRRLGHFKLLLDSIRAQTTKLSGLFISIHAPGIPIKELTRSMGCPVFILNQRQPKRQFVQYAEMLTRLEDVFPPPDNSETFILFSDDDDLWNSDRVEHYFGAWNNTNPSAYSTISSICMKESTKVSIRSCQHEPSAVEDMIQCGCVRFEFPNRMESEMHAFATEYHEYAVRPFVLSQFISAYPTLVQENRFADMQFRDFVGSYGGKEYRTILLIPHNWLYFYRKCDESYMCVTNPCHGIINLKALDSAQVRTVLGYALDMAKCPAMREQGLNMYMRHYIQLHEANAQLVQQIHSEIGAHAEFVADFSVKMDDPVWMKEMTCHFDMITNPMESYIEWRRQSGLIYESFVKIQHYQ